MSSPEIEAAIKRSVQPPTWVKRATLYGLAALLLVAIIGLAVPSLLAFRTTRLQTSLQQAIPGAVPGWAVTDLPIAESVEMARVVSNVLHFDEAMYRRYAKPGLTLDLYAAHWNPGDVPVGLVAMHTPDTCWVNAGWSRVQREMKEQRSIGATRLRPFERGEYELDGKHVHVIFWHIVGASTYDSDASVTGWTDGALGYVTRLPHLLRSFRQTAFNVKQEQFFVRISSSSPIEALWADPDFQRLILSLRSVGVCE